MAGIRKRADADLVSIWHTPPGDDSTCGKAQGGLVASQPFSVVAVDKEGCLYTFLHELGHLFGLHHDRWMYRNSQPALSTNPDLYNFGFVNVPARKFTVMAYPNKCKAQGIETCRRIRMMSTPLFTHNGDLMGI